MKKIISTQLIMLFTALCLLIQTAYAQSLTASVSRNAISINDTVQLVIRYDEATGGAPDFSVLEKDFDIVSNSRSTNRSIINNSYSVETRWMLTLAPKREGKLLIPSINYENSVSDAILIEVSPQAVSNGQNPISFESLIDKQQGHLQQQFLLTLRLKIQSGVNITGGQIEPLQIKDALTINFDEKKYRVNEQGVEYEILEYQYAIFPQASGELVIPSQLVQLEIASNVWDSRSFFSTNRGTLQRFRTQEQRLNIAPAPKDPRASPWLPAENLTIREHWSSNPDELYVGDPITRTITVTAEGLTGAQLPALPSFKLNDLNIYQDQAQIDDQKNNGKIISSRTETSAIVAAKAGDYTLPALTIHWWNTRTQEFETATLPASGLSVKSKLGGTAPNAEDTAFNSQPAASSTNNDTQISQGEFTSLSAQTSMWLWIILAISLAANVAMIVMYFLSKHRQSHQQKNLRSQRHHLQQALEQNERNAWHHLKQALKNPQPPELRNALLQWARVKFNQPNLASLDDIAKLLDSEATHQLHIIDKAIFGNGDISALDVDALESLLKRARAGAKANTQKPAPLYPE